jgi:hypothetical protein
MCGHSLLYLQVGKGLSKDEKAQKLALQHWLEAVRPGNILVVYYPMIIKLKFLSVLWAD